MNSPLRPDILLAAEPSPLASLPPARAGGLRTVWQGRFGVMLIEVIDGQPHVNGQRVEPLQCPAPPLKDPT